MRIASGRPLGSMAFNMTPMIDVVFLLIIFFLVSSHLARQEVQLELELPSASTGHVPREAAEGRVTVNVRPDGQMLLGGEPVDAAELARRLDFERQRSSEKLEVRVRSDRRVAYRYVEPVLLACARAGIWNVTFAVVRAEENR